MLILHIKVNKGRLDFSSPHLSFEFLDDNEWFLIKFYRIPSSTVHFLAHGHGYQAICCVCLYLGVIGVWSGIGFTTEVFWSVRLQWDPRIHLKGYALPTDVTKQSISLALYPDPLPFKTPIQGSIFPFSSTFSFAIISQYLGMIGYRIAFIVGNDGNTTKAHFCHWTLHHTEHWITGY